MTSDDPGRRRHYADLYEPVDHDGPLGVVLGNCQAEALRQALAGAAVRFLRVPPVHELVADDLPHLQRVLASVHEGVVEGRAVIVVERAAQRGDLVLALA